jgi:mannosyltransferase
VESLAGRRKIELACVRVNSLPWPVPAEHAAAGDRRSRVSVTPLILLGILALAAALDVFRLGARSLWLDESTSVAIAHLGWNTLTRILRHEFANMALYYGILHLWVGAFGDSEFTIRMLSVTMGLGGVCAFYVLGTRLFDARVGLIGALLLAVNAFYIAYSQEARSYSLLLFLIILASLAFLRLLDRPNRTTVISYAAAGVLAVYAHLFAVLFLMSQWLSLAFLERRSAALKAVFTGAAVICILVLPLVIASSGSNPNVLSFVPKPDARAVLDLFYDLAGASPTGAKPLLFAYFAACACAAVAGIRQFSRAPFSFSAWRYCFLGTWLFAPIVMVVTGSLVIPVFVPRYLIICLPPLVLLAAVGLTESRVRFGTAAALLLVVAMAGYEDAHYFTSPGLEDWRGATTYAASRFRPGDGFVFDPAYLQKPFEYYRARLFPQGQPPSSAVPWQWDSARPTNAETAPDSVLRRLPSQYSRIWLFGRTNGVDPHVLELLDADYPRTAEKNFHGVTVTLYGPAR